ncbi:MAG: excinuclease ABC subunit UvrC [Dehalococcoidia bacterium]|nr:excinuclease ABC subunit UvrC [Dehalococcoidia bacterium]
MSAIHLHERLRALPTQPGVYVFKDERSRVIYVGKASKLRNRVRSYFGSQAKFTPKVIGLVENISDFEFFVTASEEEALVLELNLIKKFRPRYNICLKDDKSFPYLKIDLANEFPKVTITRRVVSDGSRYFGPFASATTVRIILNLIKRVFPFRSCTRPIDGSLKRPCLDFHIKRCLGPCVGATSKEEYDHTIKQVILFLEGRLDKVADDLGSQMGLAAEAMEFEKAALLRDQIRAIQQVVEEQKIAATVKGDQDVIAFARAGDVSTVEVFFVRNGKLTGRERFVLNGTRDEGPSEIMSVFVKQFYGAAANVPALILLQHALADVSTIERWLEKRRGGKVRVIVPQKGGRKRLVDVVAENARQEQEQRRISDLSDSAAVSEALEGLKRALGLPAIPGRIECYDVSNISGTNAVGSMVVFEDGMPSRSSYRRFRIKTVDGADDYAMMQEVLGRRFKRQVSPGDGSEAWAARPDLVLIDGGKGHLGIAVKALEDVGIRGVATASIAKEHEEIFLPGVVQPLRLPAESAALRLLQRIRDEAHRFAIGYHRNLRSRESRISLLDAIPGIGAKRRRTLMRRFGSLPAIRDAPVEEISSVSGMNRATAEHVKRYLENLPV